MANRLLCILLVVAFNFCTALLGKAESNSPTPVIKLGMLTDLSGVAAFWGTLTRIGATLAAEDANSSGQRLEIVFEDSGLDTKRGVSAAQKLIFVDKVDAMYVEMTPISVAVSPLLMNNRKLMLYAAGAESVVRSNPYAFKTFSDWHLGCKLLAEEFKKRGIVRLGLLKAEAEYGELCADGIAEVYNRIVEVGYRRGESLATQMLTMKSKQVEAVINPGFPIDALNMLEAAHNIKYNPKFGISADDISEDTLIKHGDALDGSITFGLNDKLSERLTQRAESLLKRPILSSEIIPLNLAYMHTLQLLEALLLCAGKEVECAVTQLGEAKANPESGFSGWKERRARLRLNVKEIADGRSKFVSSHPG